MDQDPLLSTLRGYLLEGWPEDVPRDFKHWYKQVSELSVQDGCVLWGNRVWIPGALINKNFETLHEGHRGAVKMRKIAQDYVVWPNASKQIEEYALSCEVCATATKRSQKDSFVG